MTWDDDRKFASFIAHQDSELEYYANWVLQACRNVTVSSSTAELQAAVQIYVAMEEIGCLFRADSRDLCLDDEQGNRILANSVQLLRDTLRRTTGDRDDLTALYCALLESVGVDRLVSVKRPAIRERCVTSPLLTATLVPIGPSRDDERQT